MKVGRSPIPFQVTLSEKRGAPRVPSAETVTPGCRIQSRQKRMFRCARAVVKVDVSRVYSCPSSSLTLVISRIPADGRPVFVSRVPEAWDAGRRE